MSLDISSRFCYTSSIQIMMAVRGGFALCCPKQSLSASGAVKGLSLPSINLFYCLRPLCFLLLALFGFSLPCRAATCSSSPQNLVGWWPADGSAVDIAGTNNGTLQGGATASSPGFVANAFSFDGTNSFVAISNSAVLRPTNFTIEAWVRFTGLDSAGSGGSPAGDQYIIFRQNTRSSDFEGFDLSKTRVGGTDVFRFLVSSAAAQTAEMHSASTISTGVWYHVAAVRGSNFTQIYINGVLERQTNVAFAQDYGNFPLYFGTSGQSAWDHKLKGNLDEVSIYNRPLASNEIASIYAAGSAGKCKAPAITLQPQSQSVGLGSNATLTVAATGFSTLSYQWRFNSSPISGATSTSLTLTNVQLAAAGSYSVTVSNTLGTTTSADAILTVVSPTCAPLPPNLVSWWRAEGDGSDVITSNNATLLNGVGFTNGLVGQAFNLDGVDGRIVVSDSPSVNFGPGQDFSIEAWVRPFTNATDFDYMTVVDKRYAPNLAQGQGYEFGLSSGRIMCRLSDSIADIGTAFGPAGPDLRNGSWHHIALTVNRGSSSGGRLFVDGQPVLVFDPTVEPGDLTNGDPFRIGNHATPSVNAFYKGQIDEVSLYSRALNTTEIAAIYAANSIGKCPPPPTIVSQPASQSVYLGFSTSFSVQATGIGSLTYQWRFNGTNIPSATNSNLNLQNVQPSQAGSYSVLVSNSGGSIPSSNATLTILTPPAGVPFITSFTPISAPPSTNLVITGLNFSSIPSNNIVFFGAVRALVTSASPTSLTVTVPIGATYAPVTVTVNGLTGASKVPFKPTFLGDGSPISASTFPVRQDLPGASGPFITAIADLDGDGKPDLAIANVYAHSISLYRNIGTNGSLSSGSFASRVDLPGFGGSTSDNPVGFTSADVNGDGKIDLIITDRGSNRVTIFYNLSTPGILNSNSFSAGYSIEAVGLDPRGLAVQDLDGDGRPDIVECNYAENTISILHNISTPGSDLFEPPFKLPAGSGAYNVVIQDFDGDGRPDLAVVNASSSTVCLFRNISSPGVLNSNSFAARVDLPAVLNNEAVIVGDVDGDGLPDLITGGTSQLFSIYRNTAAPGSITTNSFANRLDYSNPGWVHKVALSDLNGDGRADIAVVGELGSFISAFQNQSSPGSISLANPVGYSTGYNPWGISVGDLDGDGRPDLVFCNTYDNTITLYHNETPFGGPPSIISQPTNVAAGINGTAVLSATVTGQAPLVYSWKRNGTNLPGSTRIIGTTNSNLIIPHLLATDAGSYSLVVTNSLGAATSVVAVLSVLNPPPCASFAADLLGWWPAENSTADVVSGLNGVIAGTGTFGYAPGVVGQAFVSDGIHRDRVDLGNPFSLQIQDFTIEAWVKRSDPNNISLDDLNQDGSTAGEGGIVLGYGRNGYGFGLLNSGQLILSKIDVDGILSSSAVTDTNWHHIAVTKLGSSAVFYIDGLPASGPINYNTSYSFTTSISIGSRGDALGGTFWGMIDEPAIYKRALSSSEILTLYNSGATGKCPQPPLVLAPPTNQTVLAGNTASFNTLGAGSPPLSYRWLFNGSPLSNNSHVAGADTTSLSLSNAQATDAGSYSVVISNSVGAVTSSVAVLTVQFVAPSFVLQPTNQAAPPGINVSLPALATGSLPIGYQWFFNSNALTDTGRIFGSLSSSLSISNCNTNDTGSYFVIASNSVGSATSSVAALFIGAPPVILQSPTNQTGLVGSNITFTVQADGTPPLGYLWRFNGAPLADTSRISGSTTPALTISNLMTSDAANFGAYDVVVTNPAGSATSAAGILTLVAAPGFAVQPISRLVVPGLPTTFTATPFGTPPVAYQWQFNGVDMPGATNTSLFISNVAATNFGVYRMTATNAYGFAISSDALLAQGNVAVWGTNTVVPLAATNVVMLAAGNNSSIYSHVLALRADGTIVSWGNNSVDQTNVPASATNIVAVAAGATHSLALRADGTLLTWGNNNSGLLNIPSSLSNVVAISAGRQHSLALRSDGKVVAWGDNPNGQLNVPLSLVRAQGMAAGSTHSIAIRSDGTLVAWGSTTDSRGTVYAPAGLSDVAAVAAGTAHSVALRSNNTIYAWSTVPGVTNIPSAISNNVLAVAASDSFSLALRSDGGVSGWGSVSTGGTNVPPYVSNAVAIAAGSLQGLALLSDGRPLITRQPVGGSSWLGRNFTLFAIALGSPPLSYRWQSNNVDIPGATNAILVLSNLTLAHAASYQIIVSNALGVASSVPVPLTVLDNSSLAFLSQPGSSPTGPPQVQTNFQGQRLLLTAGILGNGPLSYQWKLNGTNLPFGTNEDLIFDPVIVSNAGSYSLSVTNPLSFANTFSSSQRVVLVKAWGFGSNEPPVSLTNAIAIASGYAGEGNSVGGPYFALRSDGKVVGWGFTSAGATNPPASVTNSFITAVAAGYDDGLALRSDGTIAAWGMGVYGQTNPPASAVNVTAIACGDYHDLALRSDGTVVAWAGQPGNGVSNVPSSATNIVAIAGGTTHSLALRANGTVLQWGQTNGLTIPATATNIIAISAGFNNSLALRADGTVVQWPTGGQFPQFTPPTNLNNVAAIAAGYSHALALLADGTLVTWGNYYNGSAAIPADVANVIQISTRGDRDLALFGTRAPAVTVQPFDRVLFKGSNTTFNAKAVGVQPVSYQWQVNGTNIPGATSDSLTLTNLQFANAGPYQLTVSNRYGVSSTRIAKLSVTLPLPQALDTTNVNWTTSGNAPWFGEPDLSHDGVDAARSGSIGNGQESILQAILGGPAQLGFWWKVSSEQSFDFLEFKIDGVTQAAISGEVDWQQLSYPIPAGNHTLVWRYYKDPSNSAGQDAGWLDQVVYSITPPVIGVQPLGFTTNVGAPAQLSVTASGLAPLTYQWIQNQTNFVGSGSVLSFPAATRTNNGTYYINVSNGGGSTTSSNAIIKVVVPQKFSGVTTLNNGTVLFFSGDSDGGLLTTNDLSAFTAQASSNLFDWVTLPNALSITNGLLMLQDPAQTTFSSRFYRIIEH
jgi:alpha-tubulin suppressor-like RCC1 family protein